MNDKVIIEEENFKLTEQNLIKNEDSFRLQNLRSFRFQDNGKRLDLKFVYEEEEDIEIVSLTSDREILSNLKMEIQNRKFV